MVELLGVKTGLTKWKCSLHLKECVRLYKMRIVCTCGARANTWRRP